MSLYSWNKPLWEILWRSLKLGRFPHACLLTGQPGLGKSVFAQQLAQSLLCENPHQNGEACLQCRPCHLIVESIHPDFRRITPEEGSQSIKVDAIRQLNADITQTAQQGGRKVILIDRADAMNLASSNALLKILEEPTPNTHFILVSDRLSILLPTIISRCQRFDFRPPDEVVAMTWLKDQTAVKAPERLRIALWLASRAPCRAKAYLEAELDKVYERFLESLLALWKVRADPVHVAESWSESDVAQVLNWFIYSASALIKKNYSEKDLFIHSKFGFNDISSPAKQKALQGFLKAVYGYVDTYTQGVPLNTQLLMESLFIDWAKINK